MTEERVLFGEWDEDSLQVVDHTVIVAFGVHFTSQAPCLTILIQERAMFSASSIVTTAVISTVDLFIIPALIATFILCG